MRSEYDFRGAKRGAVIPDKGKERITIRLDKEVLERLRQQADEEGKGGYQTLINDVLRSYVLQEGRSDKSLRAIVRSELRDALSSLLQEPRRTAVKEIPQHATLDDATASGYMLFLSVKTVIDDAVAKNLPDKTSRFRELFTADFISPNPHLLDMYARLALLSASILPREDDTANAFREFLYSNVSISELFGNKLFESPILKDIYQEKASESEVRKLSLRGFLSLLTNSPERKIESIG